MAQFILVNLKVDSDTVKGSNAGLMAQNMKDNGKTIKLMDVGSFTTLMAMYLMASGSTTKQMDLEHILTLMDPSTRVNG